MQDRFKFRVWDKNKKQMFHDVSIGFSSITGHWVCAYTIDGQIAYTDEKLKEIEVMQCTGLWDKNGTLIYEGDLVRYTEYEIEEIEPEWEYTEIVWGENHHYPAFDLKVHEFDSNGLSFIFNEGWTIEVVGNIYEAKKIIDGVKNEQIHNKKLSKFGLE